MRKILSISLLFAHFNCGAELLQLENMDEYSVSSQRKLLGDDRSLAAQGKVDMQSVEKLGVNAIDLNNIPSIDKSNLVVRDTGHSFVVEPVLIQINTAVF